MNSQKISEHMSDIMAAIARDDAIRPTFHDTRAQQAWNAESAQIEQAGKMAAAALIADALANLGAIADAMQKLANNSDIDTGKRTLFGEVIPNSSQEHPVG